MELIARLSIVFIVSFLLIIHKCWKLLKFHSFIYLKLISFITSLPAVIRELVRFFPALTSDTE